MRKVFASLLMVVLLFTLLPLHSVNAAPTYKDGEYSVPVVVYKSGSNERSVTNDYIVTPAKLVVKNGNNTIQLTQKNASWWKSFSVNTGLISTVSEGNDTRVVQFPVSDLTKEVNASLHIVVPDINYDNKYQVRFKFDASSVPTVSGSAGAQSSNGDTDSQSSGSANASGQLSDVVENPKTGDEAPILLLAVMLLGSGLFLVRRLATN